MSLEHPVGAEKERKDREKGKEGDTENVSKGYRSQPERASNSQNWNKLELQNDSTGTQSKNKYP